MSRAQVIYRFGAFELDPANRLLLCGPERVRLREPQFSVLLHLVGNAPGVVSRDALAKAGWGGAAVNDNSIEQIVSQLRRKLADRNGTALIETVPNHGYRFVATIEHVEPQPDIASDGLDIEPFRAFVRGRRALATLKRDDVEDARREFSKVLERAPDYAPAHVGLAQAYALAFEATRVDATPAVHALAQALEHARRGTMLDPGLAAAWSTLGFALGLTGDIDAATVAAWKAVALKRDGLRHWLRLAYVSWGEDRIDAAQTALMLRPDLAFAHWLTATVLIARGAFEPALTHIRAGCTAQDKQLIVSGPYPAVGLHLLHGLVLAAQDRLGEAVEEFNRELTGLDRGQVYFRTCSANSWYALGAVHLRRGDVGAATAAFRRALELGPGHLVSMAALGLPIPAMTPNDPRAADAAIARAVGLARSGRHREAADAYRDAVSSAHVASAGWMLPVEPILHVAARPELWSDVLTIVQQRAT